MIQVADRRRVMAQVAYGVGLGGHGPGRYRVRGHDIGSGQEKVMAQVEYGVGGHDSGRYRLRGHDPGSRQEKRHGSGSFRSRKPWPR